MPFRVKETHRRVSLPPEGVCLTRLVSSGRCHRPATMEAKFTQIFAPKNAVEGHLPCGWIASIQRALPRPALQTRESNPTDPTNVGSGAGGGGGSGHVVPRQYHKGSAVPFLGPTTDGHVSSSDGVHVHSKGTKGTIPVTGDSGGQSETGVGCLHFLRGTRRPRPRPRTKRLCV